MGFFPCVCSVVGFVIMGICFWQASSTKEKIRQMKSTEPINISDLRVSAEEIARELGPGAFNQVCEVRGRLGSDAPVLAELSGRRCAMVRSKVVREWEEEREEYDPQQKRTVRRTHRGSDTVSSNEQMAPCWVEDGTGRLAVRLQGADVDLVQSVDRFEPGENASLLGRLLGPNRRTLGYRYTEELLPVDQEVYILGEVRDSEGELSMRKPDAKDKRYLISTKSEEELLREAQKKQTYLKYGAIAAAVLSTLLGVVGLITGVIGVFK